jgi:CubicO group peptidase (beta-lactamase class C family)
MPQSGSLRWRSTIENGRCERAYHSTYWADPAEDLAVVYLTQLRPTGGADDIAPLRALVYQAIVE